MDNFIKVMAKPCNSQGMTNGGVPKEMLLNYDLIGAIDRNEILLKSGIVLAIGGKYYTEITLVKT